MAQLGKFGPKTLDEADKDIGAAGNSTFFIEDAKRVVDYDLGPQHRRWLRPWTYLRLDFYKCTSEYLVWSQRRAGLDPNEARCLECQDALILLTRMARYDKNLRGSRASQHEFLTDSSCVQQEPASSCMYSATSALGLPPAGYTFSTWGPKTQSSPPQSPIHLHRISEVSRGFTHKLHAFFSMIKVFIEDTAHPLVKASTMCVRPLRLYVFLEQCIHHG